MHPITVGLIYGSTREGRLCDRVAGWAADEIAKRPEFALEVIDPLTLGLPERHLRTPHPGVEALRGKLAAADAFVVVTPEYNRGYPAPLKFLIDSAYDEWRAKPVGFVSYGGISGGLRAVEQLRLVFAEVHATTLRDSVSFANAWERFSADGALREPAAAQQAMGVMLKHLHWWGQTLRQGRDERPLADLAA